MKVFITQDRDWLGAHNFTLWWREKRGLQFAWLKNDWWTFSCGRAGFSVGRLRISRVRKDTPLSVLMPKHLYGDIE